MTQENILKMQQLGYKLLFDIFSEWENVKDEILLPERKNGSGNGTVHIFLGSVDELLRKEFSDYYESVENGEYTSSGAITIRHFFDVANIVEGIPAFSSWLNSNLIESGTKIQNILLALSSCINSVGYVETSSFFKLSLGASKLRPYFKQFNGDGVFNKVIRVLLFHNSCYKISLFKDDSGNYATFWELKLTSSCSTQFDNIEPIIVNRSLHLPLQQIYYGAPGTGKSYTINEQTEGESVIRTTFHPDSDYSTFVGAYKPTMGLLPICDELGTPLQIMGKVPYKEQIIYEFVEQAFLQAYVNAWKNLVFNGGKKQYLVIEEINRGNCAQIFGDLFQLLDRNVYGFSDYPIHADKDMQKFLKKAFARTDDPSKQIFLQEDEKLCINNMYRSKDDVVSKVLSGEILLLPNNLYIWATMNTSDQSLFPIDSAFKRRWEWQYMPIGKGYDEKGQEIKWAIEGATKKYDWWSFLNKINAEVGEATQSEDKKLGFFFCKATDGVITAEKFVGKVIFYLWSDVFKNNGFEGPIFRDVDGTELSFSKFYKSDMKGNAIVQKDKVELFLNNLGVEEAGFVEVEEEVIEMDEDGNETSTSSNSSYDRSKYSINGVGNYGKGNVAYEAVKLYVANNPTKTADEIVKEWLALGMKITGFVETQAAFNDRKNASKDPNLERRRKIVTLSNGELIYVSNQYGPDRIADLMSKVNATNWGISISKV